MVSIWKVLGSGRRGSGLQTLHAVVHLAPNGDACQQKWWASRRRTLLTTASTFESSPILVRTRPAQPRSASALPLNLSPGAVSRTWPNQLTGGPERPSGLQMALEERATRLLALPEGNHTPSTSPALLDVLTDENIVVAVAAVEAVAARQPAPPSANALKKLLATVVADDRLHLRPEAVPPRAGRRGKLAGAGSRALAAGRSAIGTPCHEPPRIDSETSPSRVRLRTGRPEYELRYDFLGIPIPVIKPIKTFNEQNPHTKPSPPILPLILLASGVWLWTPAMASSSYDQDCDDYDDCYSAADCPTLDSMRADVIDSYSIQAGAVRPGTAGISLRRSLL
jgi:hypothetical protein